MNFCNQIYNSRNILTLFTLYKYMHVLSTSPYKIQTIPVVEMKHRFRFAHAQAI